MKTLTITNFGGPLTRRNYGEVNSGLAKLNTSWGYDPYSKPGNLTWLEQPVSIMTFTPSSSTTGLYRMKLREENGTSAVYGFGGRATPLTLYKISPSSNATPNLDTVSVIGTINASVLFGSGMEFYGSTEKIFTAANGTITKVNFDGSSASIIGTGFTNRPMPMATFNGRVYFGNDRNIGEIDSTEAITTPDKLNPALPADTTVTDLDVTPDGNYLQITASKSNSPIFVGGTATITPPRTPVESFKFYWNGIDDGITSYDTYGGTTFFASEVFGEYNYVAGQDAGGGVLMNNRSKVTIPGITNLSAAATYSISDTFGMVVPEFDDADNKYKAAVFHYGAWDDQVQRGLYRLLRHEASELNDIMFVPSGIVVNGFSRSPSVLGLNNNVSGVGKVYFSATEIAHNSSTNRQHRLWRFNFINSGIASVVAGVYETQNQAFSKKTKVGEVRFYTEPLVADNSFSIGILNSASSVIASNTYTVGSTVTAGEDVVRWTPQIPPQYALGFRITNIGSANWTGTKLEADIEEAGS